YLIRSRVDCRHPRDGQDAKAHYGQATAGRLEARRGAETDQLLVVEALFEERLGNVEPQGSERRFPDDAGTRRGANSAGIGQANTRIEHGPGDRIPIERLATLRIKVFRPLPGAEQRAGIDEGRRAHAKLLRNEGYGEAQLRRGRPVGAAAEGIVGQQVARTEAATVKTANGFPALVEQVDEPHVLAAPAFDMTAHEAADEGDLVADRKIDATLGIGAHVLHIAAET